MESPRLPSSLEAATGASLVARELEPAEVKEVCAALFAGDPAAEEAWHESAAAALSASPLGALGIFHGGAAWGLLIGEVAVWGYRIQDLWAGEGALGRAAAAAAALLGRRFAGQRVEIDVVEGQPALEEAILGAGFERVDELLHVERELGADLGGEPDPFDYRGFHDVGKVGIGLAIERTAPSVAALASRPGSQRLLDDAIHRVLKQAGVLDASLWRVAILGGEPVGVALAQRDFPTTGCGVIFYLGIDRARQGQGLGRSLHAATLRALRAAGMLRYEDTTSTDNQPMRRLLERHGCREVGRARRCRLARPATPAWITSFDELARFLDGRGYEVQVLEPGAWLALTARFAEDEAELAICWRPDAELAEVVHVLDPPAPPRALVEAARYSGWLNHALTLPGFALDEASRLLRYRLPAMFDGEWRLSPCALLRTMEVVVHTAADQGPPWRRRVAEWNAPARASLLETVPASREPSPRSAQRG